MTVLTRGWWDWIDDEIGEPPTGWDEPWNGTFDGWSVELYNGRKVLEHADPYYQSEPVIILTPEGTPETSADMEIYAEGEITDYGATLSVWLLAEPWTPGSGYLLMLDSGRNEITLSAMFGGSGFELATKHLEEQPEPGARFCIRATHIAAELHVRVWKRGGTEPETPLFVVGGGYFQDGLAGLGPALYGYTSRWYGVGIGLDGDPAPAEPIDDDPADPDPPSGGGTSAASATSTGTGAAPRIGAGQLIASAASDGLGAAMRHGAGASATGTCGYALGLAARAGGGASAATDTGLASGRAPRRGGAAMSAGVTSWLQGMVPRRGRGKSAVSAQAFGAGWARRWGSGISQALARVFGLGGTGQRWYRTIDASVDLATTITATVHVATTIEAVVDLATTIEQEVRV